jgi:hypothetical protein
MQSMESIGFLTYYQRPEPKTDILARTKTGTEPKKCFFFIFKLDMQILNQKKLTNEGYNKNAIRNSSGTRKTLSKIDKNRIHFYV